MERNKLQTKFDSKFKEFRDPSCPRQHIVKYYRSGSDFFDFNELTFLCPTARELNSFIKIDQGSSWSGYTGMLKNTFIDYEIKYYLDDKFSK